MKPHPRIRKTVKWGGAVVSVVLLLLWIASNWCVLVYAQRWPCSWDLTVCQVVELEWGSYPINPANAGLRVESNTSGASGFIWSVSRRGGMVQSPLWALVSASALGTAAFCWLDARARRVRAGACSKCDYDLTGLVGAVGAVCPECGAAAPVSAALPTKGI